MRRSLLRCVALMLVAAAAAPVALAADDLTALTVVDLKVGTGALARDGMQVELNYTGWLYDASAPDHHGARIDSSYDHGQTITFTLGEGKVIAGWDKGIKGMHVGGKRTLLIPPRLGYRGRRVGKLVPATASLVFDVDLVSVH